jgi:hypothetical protein
MATKPPEDGRPRADAAERLLADVAAAPAAPEGPCLEPGDLVEYALDLMEEAARARAARHVESCPSCLDEVIALVEERRAWERRADRSAKEPSFLPARDPEGAPSDAPPPGKPRRR